MPLRVALVARIAELTNGALRIDDFGDGWPALGVVEVADIRLEVAIFASTVGLSHRNRDDVERRFQNPAGQTPLEAVPGRSSILIGLWDTDGLVDVINPVLVLADANRRDDGRRTRWSVFIPIRALIDASAAGWTVHVTESSERLLLMTPELLPVAVSAVAMDVPVDDRAVHSAIEISALSDFHREDDDDTESSRLRRVASILVRDATFSRDVLSAYEGRCAMCGLGIGLVQGAHIYPASAPGSTDHPSNGLALCANHHVAFDRHMMGVDPTTWKITFRPDLIAHASVDARTLDFIRGTYGTLETPSTGFRPDWTAFPSRYSFFAGQYDWM